MHNSIDDAVCETLAHWSGRLLPIDPSELAQSIGLSVCPADGDNLYNSTKDLIAVNFEQDEELQRLSTAFLLGCHMLELGSYQCEGQDPTVNPDPLSRQAVQFALEVLMPQSAVEYVIIGKDITTQERLCQIFGVSETILRQRLRQLNLIKGARIGLGVQLSRSQ